MKYYDEDDEAYFKSLAEKISLDREQIEMWGDNAPQWDRTPKTFEGGQNNA
jgi:hypothetical protein